MFAKQLKIKQKKKQKDGFLGALIPTLCASLLGKMLTGKAKMTHY